jgi:hypothetical protein
MSKKIITSDPLAETDEGGRVSFIEAVSYTAIIGFIALFASGLFDGMVAWK